MCVCSLFILFESRVIRQIVYSRVTAVYWVFFGSTRLPFSSNVLCYVLFCIFMFCFQQVPQLGTSSQVDSYDVLELYTPDVSLFLKAGRGRRAQEAASFCYLLPTLGAVGSSFLRGVDV